MTTTADAAPATPATPLWMANLETPSSGLFTGIATVYDAFYTVRPKDVGQAGPPWRSEFFFTLKPAEGSGHDGFVQGFGVSCGSAEHMAPALVPPAIPPEMAASAEAYKAGMNHQVWNELIAKLVAENQVFSLKSPTPGFRGRWLIPTAMGGNVSANSNMWWLVSHILQVFKDATQAQADPVLWNDGNWWRGLTLEWGRPPKEDRGSGQFKRKEGKEPIHPLVPVDYVGRVQLDLEQVKTELEAWRQQQIAQQTKSSAYYQFSWTEGVVGGGAGGGAGAAGAPGSAAAGTPPPAQVSKEVAYSQFLQRIDASFASGTTQLSKAELHQMAADLKGNALSLAILGVNSGEVFASRGDLTWDANTGVLTSVVATTEATTTETPA